MSAPVCLVCGAPGATAMKHDNELVASCRAHMGDVGEFNYDLIELGGRWRNRARERRPSALETTLENAVRRDLRGGPAAQWSGVRIGGHWKR